MLPYFQSIQSTDDLLFGSLLLVDKPKGWTSFDAVHKIRNLIQRKFQVKKFKVGHSGTLDPMATGLLLICTGAWTKKLHELQGLDKKYLAEITLGVETDTYDAEGATVSSKDVPHLSNEDLVSCLKSFTGELMQVPPVYSAIKKEGKPLYELARAGKTVQPEARKVIVYNIRLVEYTAPKLTIEIHSGSGFYVRSLAHDIGEKLECGAHLSALSRTSIGEYKLEHAIQMEDLVAAFS